jgi:hypothetical protein
MGTKSVFSVLMIKEYSYTMLLWDGHVLFVPKGSSFRLVVVFGVREGKSMQAMTNTSKVTVDKE